MKKKGEGSKLVVVKQFRPPLGKFTVELPAGDRRRIFLVPIRTKGKECSEVAVPLMDG